MLQDAAVAGVPPLVIADAQSIQIKTWSVILDHDQRCTPAAHQSINDSQHSLNRQASHLNSVEYNGIRNNRQVEDLRRVLGSCDTKPSVEASRCAGLDAVV